MSDLQKRVCGYCHLNRDWIWNGQKLKDGSKIYIDHSGNRWAGRRCPVCEKSRVATAIRHDAFDKHIIYEHLNQKGFQIKSATHPMLVEKGGDVFQVGIRRAKMDQGRIVVESAADVRDDLIALVFESVRLVTAEQLQNMQIHNPDTASSTPTSSSPTIQQPLSQE